MKGHPDPFWRRSEGNRRRNFMDLIYIGIIIAFFLATWGLLKLCDALQKDKPEGHP